MQSSPTSTQRASIPSLRKRHTSHAVTLHNNRIPAIRLLLGALAVAGTKSWVLTDGAGSGEVGWMVLAYWASRSIRWGWEHARIRNGKRKAIKVDVKVRSRTVTSSTFSDISQLSSSIAAVVQSVAFFSCLHHAEPLW